MSQPPYSLPGSTGEGAPQLTPTHGLPGQHSVQYGPQPGESDKSFIVTWLLGWLLGSFGADRFYLGKIGTAIAKLVTAGGFGIWALIDLIMHLVGATRDKQGRRLAGYDQHKKKAWIITIGVWLLQVVIAIIVTVIVAFTGGFSVSGGVSTGNGPQPSDSSPADPGDDQGDDTGDDTGDQGGDTGQQASGDATAWAESTFGTFDPVTVDGSGDEIVPMPDGIDAAIVTIEVKGDRARATAVDDAEEIAGSMYLSGQSGDTLQSDVGIDDYRETAGIDVSGSGDWTLTFAPISSAPALPESGSDSGIFLYDGDGGPVTFDYVGDSNFIVHQLGDGGTDLLANEIDSWSGDAEMVPGPSIVRVQASGDWTITPG
jgi:TM2 domain-containing membrane protein YozV